MRKLIKIFFSVYCLIFCFTMSGCWNYREIEDFAIVTGIAVDKISNGYLVTTEIINIGGGKNAVIETITISSEGITIFDAVRNGIKVTGKKLYHSHSKVFIISEEIAKEGVVPVLDWFGRDAEPRYDINLLVAKGKTAKDILEQKAYTEDVLSFELNDMIDAQKRLAVSPDIKQWNFLNDLSGKGIAAILPVVSLDIYDKKTVVKIEGTGIFKKDKMIGYLDGDETKMLLFIRNKIEGGLLIAKINEDKVETNISLEIFKNKTTLKPLLKTGSIVMEITTETEVAIGENGSTINYIDEEGREKLKRIFEEMMEEDIKKLIKKVQKEYRSDIFGFGRTLRINKPYYWKQVENRWDEIFPIIEVNVNSTVTIRNSAYQSKPIKVGD